MKLIEFFDENYIENLACTLQYQPEAVVLVGHSDKQLTHAETLYEAIANAHGLGTRFTHRTVPSTDLSEIIVALACIIDEADDTCVFELTGGDEMYLVAAGIVAERSRDQVHLSHMNLREGTIKRHLPRGSTTQPLSIGLSVEENIQIYGGALGSKTKSWKFSEEFCKDVEILWQISSQMKDWNRIAIDLATMIANDEGKILPQSANRPPYQSLISKLLRHQLLFTCEKGYRFKDKQIQSAVCTSGQVLELWIAAHLLSARNEQGAVFTDVRPNVILEWDDVVDNEIDVMATKGALPLFISCKNGKVDSDEFYKLSQVADRFGGSYAKKALVARSLGASSNPAVLRERAAEMGITLLEIDKIGEQEVISRLLSI